MIFKQAFLDIQSKWKQPLSVSVNFMRTLSGSNPLQMYMEMHSEFTEYFFNPVRNIKVKRPHLNDW